MRQKCSAASRGYIPRSIWNRVRDPLFARQAVNPASPLRSAATAGTARAFVQPTLLIGADPLDEIFTVEYFGPLLAVHVYDDADYAKMLRLVEQSTRYGLTGSIVARDPNVGVPGHGRQRGLGSARSRVGGSRNSGNPRCAARKFQPQSSRSRTGSETGNIPMATEGPRGRSPARFSNGPPGRPA